MDWSLVGNVITNGAVIIAALVMAIEEALRRSPNMSAKLPSWVVSPNWNFVPLVLLSLAGAIYVVRASHTSPFATSAVPDAFPLPSDVERATPITAATAFPRVVSNAFTPVANTLIKPEDQTDLAVAIKKDTDSVSHHCRALILRCPSVGCEDDSDAVMAVLRHAGWDMPWPPTSHGWEHLKSRLVIHSRIEDICAVILANNLYNFGIKREQAEDPAMRKSDHIEIIIQRAK